MSHKIPQSIMKECDFGQSKMTQTLSGLRTNPLIGLTQLR